MDRTLDESSVVGPSDEWKLLKNQRRVPQMDDGGHSFGKLGNSTWEFVHGWFTASCAGVQLFVESFAVVQLETINRFSLHATDRE